MKNYALLKSLSPILIGFIVWVLIIADQIPYSVFDLSHVEALLIAAPLWLIPLAWYIGGKNTLTIWLALCCGILFTVAYRLEQGLPAAMLVIPWLLFSVVQAFRKVLIFKFTNIIAAVELVAYLYLPIGIFWAIINRLGVTILGYDPTIILLTAVHFHYAGFILPQVTSWVLKKHTAPYAKTIGIGIIAGIPLVAVGISASHYQWPVWIEVLSVSVMTLAGASVGILHIFRGLKTKKIAAKICFVFGGFALLVGMALAFSYGWRHVFVIETLTIPWMYAVHGTCNAVGFAGPVLLAYLLTDEINNRDTI